MKTQTIGLIAAIEMYERIDTWLGPEEAKKLLDVCPILNHI